MGMINIGEKKITRREAIAEAKVIIKPAVLESIKDGKVPKGNVLEAAKLAGILAAKKTPEIIPLCHPIPIECVTVDFSVEDEHVKIIATVKGEGKTGMEMEALTAASVAGLTIYDMCKPLDKEIVIDGIKLIKKTGGKSGTYERK